MNYKGKKLSNYQKIGDFFFRFLAWIGSSSYGFVVIPGPISEKLLQRYGVIKVVKLELCLLSLIFFAHLLLVFSF